ncbi:hypothetical protein [Nocardia carnea]|uniref:hypothetical protein n=1 Tax=Nocardia carnea TaxID=37328 RepID=UPI002454D73C|nr:hypothetical protein [Nocardia carnea]
MNGLALAGFVLSLIALAWNVVLATIRWPRISVEIKKTIHLTTRVLADGKDTHSVTETYKLVVINTGAEACTIANVGLIAGDIGFDYDIASQAGEQLPGGDPLPARIEGHGCLFWIFEETELARFAPSSGVYGYAERYVPYRRVLQRWPKFQKVLNKALRRDTSSSVRRTTTTNPTIRPALGGIEGTDR